MTTEETSFNLMMPPLTGKEGEAATRSVRAFQAYLKQHDLEPLQVAQAAGVRYLTIWNILHGNPIHSRNALTVRVGLYNLTGVTYTELILVIGEKETP